MFSQVTGVHSMDAQTCGGRGMGLTTRLQNHGREVTWVWHYGARKSHGKCHVRHVDAGTRGMTFKETQAWTCGFSRHGVSTLWMHKSVVAEACVRILDYRGTVVKSQETRTSGNGTM